MIFPRLPSAGVSSFHPGEIYGGIGGFYDYGPLGAVLKRNVRDAWWHDTVVLRDDVVAFDSSIIMHPLTWKASGHIDVFSDKMVDCRQSASTAFAPTT